jgi:hypothetical protein
VSAPGVHFDGETLFYTRRIGSTEVKKEFRNIQIADLNPDVDGRLYFSDNADGKGNVRYVHEKSGVVMEKSAAIVLDRILLPSAR